MYFISLPAQYQFTNIHYRKKLEQALKFCEIMNLSSEIKSKIKQFYILSIDQFSTGMYGNNFDPTNALMNNIIQTSIQTTTPLTL